MAPFYGWGSTASRLEPLRGGSLLFTTKFPEAVSSVIQSWFLGSQITGKKKISKKYRHQQKTVTNMVLYFSRPLLY